MSCNDHCLCRDISPVCDCLVFPHLPNKGILINGQMCCNGVQEFQRMKLRLIREHHCACRWKGQGQMLAEHRLITNSCKSGQLLLQRISVLHRINIVRLSLIITVDFPAKLRIFFKGKPVGMQEFLRRFQALTFQKLLIIQTMLKRDLSRCISRGSAANTPLFHKHAIHTALFQKVCRQNSDNAAADNQHISFRIPLQLRKAWRLCTVLPD